MYKEKHVLVKQKNKKEVYEWAKHGFATTSLNQNDCPWSGKKKFYAQQSEKKAILIVFWDTKGSITIDFLEKGAMVDSANSIGNISPY